MTTHVAQAAGAEIEAFAPVDRVIVLFANEGPRRAHPQP